MTHHEHPNVSVVREGFQAMQRGDTAWMGQHLAGRRCGLARRRQQQVGRAYQGKAKVLEFFARQAQSTDGPPSVEIHDIMGNDGHVVVLGTAKATARDGSSAEWKYTQVSHSRDGKTTEVGGMAENDDAVDPFLDSLPS